MTDTETNDKGPLQGRREGAPKLAWHHASVDEVGEYWCSSKAGGVTDQEARDRLSAIGPNALPEEPPTPLWRRIWAQLSDVTVLALVAAALIAAALGLFASEAEATFVERFGDTIAILAIVVINAVLGLVQERRAERALKALTEMTAPTARVVRAGRAISIPSAEVVPGDMLLLEDGDRVPADARLVEASDLMVDESALTGESAPVEKDAFRKLPTETPLAERVTMVFMGTRIYGGRARAICTNTGTHTELGAIAGMLARVESEKTPLEKDLDRFGKRIVIACGVISGVVFSVGMLMGRSTPRELFLVAVALAVAAIPEGLPAVTTIVLAFGTQRMAKRNALVRRLPAVETLGCAQVICTDKTGTLTQNMMTVQRVHTGGVTFDIVDGKLPDLTEIAGKAVAEIEILADAAVFATGATLTDGPSGKIEVAGDPTDGAILKLARLFARTTTSVKVAERPFSSDRRMASTLVARGDRTRSYVRGAPEAVFDQSTHVILGGQRVALDHDKRRALADEAAAWAARAMRVIALAYRDDLPIPEGSVSKSGAAWETELTFIGLVGIIDPPRPEVRAAIAEARRAGVHTVMITGDHPATARAIGEDIGLWKEGDLVITGIQIDSLDQQRLEEQVDRVRIVARATAEHKLRIVTALKARGIICAMTGDGVNDAPAVKAASIGIAMGRTGTDVTKEASDLVLADDNYATIVAAIEEGRTIYANIRKFIFFLLSSNAGAVLFVLAASLLGWESPLAPIQILWINLITNGLPALALGIEPREEDEMHKPPRDPGGAILNLAEYGQIVLVGAVMAATALYAFSHAMVNPASAQSPAELAHARAMVFAILSVGPLFHGFNCRSERRSIFSLGVFTNRALWIAFGIGITLQSITIWVPALNPIFKTAPLGAMDVVWVFLLSAAPFVLGEIFKLMYYGRARAPAVAKV